MKTRGAGGGRRRQAMRKESKKSKRDSLSLFSLLSRFSLLLVDESCIPRILFLCHFSRLQIDCFALVCKKEGKARSLVDFWRIEKPISEEKTMARRAVSASVKIEKNKNDNSPFFLSFFPLDNARTQTRMRTRMRRRRKSIFRGRKRRRKRNEEKSFVPSLFFFLENEKKKKIVRLCRLIFSFFFFALSSPLFAPLSHKEKNLEKRESKEREREQQFSPKHTTNTSSSPSPTGHPGASHPGGVGRDSAPRRARGGEFVVVEDGKETNITTTPRLSAFLVVCRPPWPNEKMHCLVLHPLSPSSRLQFEHSSISQGSFSNLSTPTTGRRRRWIQQQGTQRPERSARKARPRQACRGRAAAPRRGRSGRVGRHDRLLARSRRGRDLALGSQGRGGEAGAIDLRARERERERD